MARASTQNLLNLTAPTDVVRHSVLLTLWEGMGCPLYNHDTPTLGQEDNKPQWIHLLTLKTPEAGDT